MVERTIVELVIGLGSFFGMIAGLVIGCVCMLGAIKQYQLYGSITRSCALLWVGGSVALSVFASGIFTLIETTNGTPVLIDTTTVFVGTLMVFFGIGLCISVVSYVVKEFLW